MILVVCLPCASAVRIMPASVADTTSNEELEILVGRKSNYWPNKFPCWTCGGSATGMRETEADPRVLRLMVVHDLTPQEAFAVFNGCGFPEEQVCAFDVIEALLRAQPIRRVIGKDIPLSARAVIDSIELWDGTKLHFGAAVEGAIVYRIVRPHSYVQAAEKEGVLACQSK
jgi:hypothetical protein